MSPIYRNGYFAVAKRGVLLRRRFALHRYREIVLAIVFLSLAAWEVLEFAVLEVRGGPSLPVAVVVHAFQVLVILVATWAVLRAWQDKSTREQALSTMVEKVTFAQDDERRRIAYEIHDGLAPLIVSAKQHADTAADFLDADPARTRDELARSQDRLRRAVDETRRILMALRPAGLDTLGLGGAVRELIDDARRQGGARVTVDDGLGPGRLLASVETAAFRIVQEALSNALRHAATGTIDVALRRHDAALVLVVSDHGTGFAPSDVVRRGLGLASMEERARLVGGRVTVESAPGRGTRVEAWLPLEAPARG